MYNKLLTQIKESIYCRDVQDKFFMDSMFAPFTMIHYIINKKINIPIWVVGVAPPGSGKTLRISLFDKIEDNYKVSVLTANAFMSGYRDKDGNDPSILPELNGKVLTIKDMTAVYQQGKESRDSIIGQMRDIFDGSAAKATGMTGITEYQSLFNMMAMITNIYDSFYSVSTVLGERFIPIRLYSTNDDTAAISTIDNIIYSRCKDITKLQCTVKRFMKTFKHPPLDTLGLEQYKKYIVILTNVVCRIRTHVIRDPSGNEIAAIPQMESNTRLSAQFLLMLANYLMLNTGADRAAGKAYLSWLGRCSLPMVRLHIIHWMYRIKEKVGKRIPFKDLFEHCGIGKNMLKQTLDDFRAMDLINARSNGVQRGRIEYELTDAMFSTFKSLKFFCNHDWEQLQPKLVERGEDEYE